jgi:hypothetical protein
MASRQNHRKQESIEMHSFTRRIALFFRSSQKTARSRNHE